MTLTDVHTHSTYSFDGVSPLGEMIAAAYAKGLRYFGVSEHFDRDYAFLGLKIDGKPVPATDAAAYFGEGRRLQTEYAEKGLRVLIGGEYGFSPEGSCCAEYAALTRGYRPDFVVNSVHTTDGEECYCQEYFRGKSKRYAYSRYLERVRESLDAPYDYDIVAHIGYVSRNAPYADKKLRYEEFPSLLDDILKTVVAKGKILEVNSSARGAGSDFLPDEDILTRYFELGGRLVSFGSDAHDVGRVSEKRELIVRVLRKIGFTAVTVPDCGRYLPIGLDP